MLVCKLCDRDFGQLQKAKRKRCNSCNTKIRRYRTKKAAVEYLGGKCVRCGYNENIVALEFHHRDPNKKNFTIGGVANKSWDSIKNEIDKCELLCSNCHKVEHSKRDRKFLEEAENYKGRLFK